jgi:hypothetical protein
MNAILTFQGFQESESRRTGTEDLWWNIIRPLAGPHCTTYHPRTWTTRTVPLLEQLRRQRIQRLALVSYSHGQAAALDLARKAPDYGLDVDLWLACDPVYRPAWLPRWNLLQPFSFRALIPGSGKIAVPPSIRRVAWCRQREVLPHGADLLAEDSTRTHILPPLVLALPHTQLDHSLRWAETVQTELAAWLHPPAAKPIAEPVAQTP